MRNWCLSDMEAFGGQSHSSGLSCGFGKGLPQVGCRAVQVPDSAGRWTPARLLEITQQLRGIFPGSRWAGSNSRGRGLPAAGRCTTAASWQPAGSSRQLGSYSFGKQAVLDSFTAQSQCLILPLSVLGLWIITGRANYHSPKRQHSLVHVTAESELWLFYNYFYSVTSGSSGVVVWFSLFVCLFFETGIWCFRCTV